MSAWTRSKNKEQSAAQVVTAFKEEADLSNKCALLRVCGCLSGPAVLNVLRDGIKNSNKDIQDAAARSLASLQDLDAVTDQLAYASSTSNLTHRILLLRGCMKLVDENTTMPADRKIKICKEIMSTTDRVEEKMLVISCLGKINTIGALTTLETFLSDPSMKTAAATAMLKVGKSPDVVRTDMSRNLLHKAEEVLNIPQKK